MKYIVMGTMLGTLAWIISLPGNDVAIIGFIACGFLIGVIINEIMNDIKVRK